MYISQSSEAFPSPPKKNNLHQPLPWIFVGRFFAASAPVASRTQHFLEIKALAFPRARAGKVPSCWWARGRRSEFPEAEEG